MFSFLYQKNKYYLNGIDWIISVLDLMTRKSIGLNNFSHVVIETQTLINKEELTLLLNQNLKKFPFLNGYIKRNYNLAPYWKIPNKKNKNQLNIKYIVSENNDIHKIFNTILNIPFKSREHYLSFFLIKEKDKNYFIMKFDHRIFDAYGAEQFLNIIKDFSLDKKYIFKNSSNLCKWKDKFFAGKTINRFFIKLLEGNKKSEISILLNPIKRKKIFSHIVSFNEKETEFIINKAYNKAGYLFIMPYLLAVTIKSLNNFLLKRKFKIPAYIIPVNINMRDNKKEYNTMFFNHLSFLFFKFSNEDLLQDISFIIKQIKTQMYNQIEEKIPNKILQATYLTRIVPLFLLNKIINSILKNKKLNGFSFSYIESNINNFFIEEKINNIFHMPCVPTPPGLGIFFNKFQDKLNLTISFVDSLILDKKEIKDFTNSIKDNLLKDIEK